MVECLTQDRGVAGLRLTGVTARALGNAELRVLVRTFFPWDACFPLGRSSAYACFFSRHAPKIQ